jgi:hypothetical protein
MAHVAVDDRHDVVGCRQQERTPRVDSCERPYRLAVGCATSHRPSQLADRTSDLSVRRTVCVIPTRPPQLEAGDVRIAVARERYGVDAAIILV